MWFSSGGTKSVLHLDEGFDNINCLFRGTKELLFIDYYKYKDKVGSTHLLINKSETIKGLKRSFTSHLKLVNLLSHFSPLKKKQSALKRLVKNFQRRYLVTTSNKLSYTVKIYFICFMALKILNRCELIYSLWDYWERYSIKKSLNFFFALSENAFGKIYFKTTDPTELEISFGKQNALNRFSSEEENLLPRQISCVNALQTKMGFSKIQNSFIKAHFRMA